MIKFACRILWVGALLMFSCKKDNGSNCPYDPCESKAPDNEIKNIEAYLSRNNITAVKHCSGMYYQVTDAGTGDTPTSCSWVSVSYTGILTDSTVFAPPSNPVSFNLLELIEGWKKGIPLIKTSGKIKLIVPPSLAYGAAARPGIPASSILIFDITLLEVR